MATHRCFRLRRARFRDAPFVRDARRIEVHGAQLAIDARIVSPVTRTGSARPGPDTRPAATVQDAARRKRRQTYPEQAGASRARVYSGLRLAGASALKLPPSCASSRNTVPPATRHRCERLRALAGCRGGLGCLGSSLLLRCESTRLLCSSSRPLAGEACVAGEAPELHEILADVQGSLPLTISRLRAPTSHAA